MRRVRWPSRIRTGPKAGINAAGAAETEAGAYPYRCLPRHGLESAPVTSHDKPPAAPCPETLTAVSEESPQAVDDLVQLCLRHEGTFGQFEQQLFVLMAALGCAMTRLFLATRHQRLDLAPYLQDG